MTVEIRPIVLRQELMVAYREVQAAIEEIEDRASFMDIKAHQMKDERGNYIVIPLYAARAQILHSLVLLNRKGD